MEATLAEVAHAATVLRAGKRLVIKWTHCQANLQSNMKLSNMR